MAAQRKHEVETTYINSWVESGVYSLVVNVTVAAEMRRQRLDLVDINHLLRTGNVVRSDMAESKGLWDVRGRLVDGAQVEVKVAVVSAECEVELLRILKVQRRGE